MQPPPRRSRLPRTPDVDEYLSPEQEQGLRVSAAEVAWHWQDEHGCSDPQCLRCRVGRALAILSNAYMDGQAATDILCGLIPDLVAEAPTMQPLPDAERYAEACQLLIRALDTLEQSGLQVAKSMRTPTTSPTLPDDEKPDVKGLN